MADTHETTADIIAEIRALSNPISDGIIAINGRSIADRLEAAYRREKAAIEADALEVGGMVEAERKREISERVTRAVKNTAKIIDEQKRVGDAAKLREALKQVNELNDLWFDTFTLPDGATSIHDEIEDVISAALAAPPRNCDVGTAEEQAERWYWRYHVGHLCQSCPLGPRKWSEVDAGTLCFSEWLQMPYEEGGAK